MKLHRLALGYKIVYFNDFFPPHELSTIQYCCISAMYQGLLFFPPSRHKSAPCCVWVTWTPSLNSLWWTKFPPVSDTCSGRLSLSLDHETQVSLSQKTNWKRKTNLQNATKVLNDPRNAIWNCSSIKTFVRSRHKQGQQVEQQRGKD